MRILLIAPSFFPRVGGVETVVRELAGHFLRNDHAVLVVSNRYPRSLKWKENIDGIPVLRPLFLYPELLQLRSGRPDLFCAGIGYFPLTLLVLFYQVLRFRPDVINLHFLGRQAFFVWIVRRIIPVPLIVSLHGADVDAEPLRSRFHLWLLRKVLADCSSFSCCSRSLLEEVRQLAPDVIIKGQVVPNGVDVRLFASAPPTIRPKPYVLGVGRLAHHKGFDLLVAAYAMGFWLHDGVDLVIAGEGEEEDALRQQAADLDVHASVDFVGSHPPSAIASLMRGARVIVIPSRREPFGIVGLEARASGRPVIAANVGGLPEALANSSVQWFDSGNVSSLFDALAGVLGGTKQLECANRRIVSDDRSHRLRTWDDVGQEYLALYRKVCLG